MPAPYVSHSRHLVLVVDDDDKVLQTLREILSRDGFGVLTAHDALHALRAAPDSQS